MSGPTGGIAGWVVDVIDHLGYAGVSLLVALENVFPPIPSEVVLPAAGAHASDGRSLVAGMIAASTVGSVVGAWILYLVAARIGTDRLHRVIERRGRWVGMQPQDLDRADRWFDERGERAVLLGRCVPVVRSLVSIPAGLSGMAPVRFTVYTALGSLVWNSTLVMLGFSAYQYVDEVAAALGYVSYAIVAALAVAVAVSIWRRRVRDAR